MTEIQKWLFEHEDTEYADFSAKLNPTIERGRFIGVRTPELRAYAKELVRNHREKELLDILPHEYFEENQLHAFILSECKDYEKMLSKLEKFLPYVDNWATCDQMSPKIIKKHRAEFKQQIDKWIRSEHTYTIRFAIGMLMEFYLEDAFEETHLEQVASVRSEEYYVKMMMAWYFATALAKQYDATISLMERKVLDKWVQNKTIQKARESRRISQETKEYLKTLKK